MEGPGGTEVFWFWFVCLLVGCEGVQWVFLCFTFNVSVTKCFISAL